MTRRQLTAWIAIGAVGAAVLAVTLFKRNEPAAPIAPVAAEQDAKSPADEQPAQIQAAPQSTPDVFMPPATNATGSSAAPKPDRR